MARSSAAATTGLNDVATPNGGHQDVPSLQEFMQGICVKLNKPPDFLESVVSAFKAEDVISVELLITMFGVPTQYSALKTDVQNNGPRVSTMFWALLETNLKPLIESMHPTQGPPQRRRVSTEPTEEGSSLNVNEALRAGARSGKFALSLGSFVGVMKHACVSLSPFVVRHRNRSKY